MFADKIDALRRLVVQRQRVIHQKNLDSRRWSVRRDVMRGVKDTFLPALEAAIAKSHSDYGHTVILRTYSVDEWEKTDCDGITLGEVLEKTDVLQRVSNCLAPGFFNCRVRATVARQPGIRVRVYEVIARFYADGMEYVKPPCTCVCSYLTDGFCDVCGGHNVRDLVRYPREDAADGPMGGCGYAWKCHACRNEDQKELLHCVACGSERLNAAAILAARAAPRQINNPEDEVVEDI